MQDFGSSEIHFATSSVNINSKTLLGIVRRDSENTPIKEVLNSARVGWDLGSSYGYSADLLKQICPNLSELHGVDVGVAVSSPKIRKAIGDILKTHDNITISQFIKQSIENKGNRADVVMMSSIPTPGFNESDYNNLAEMINKGGVLIALGDTKLEGDLMKLYFNRTENSKPVRNYWVKK